MYASSCVGVRYNHFSFPTVKRVILDGERLTEAITLLALPRKSKEQRRFVPLVEKDVHRDTKGGLLLSKPRGVFVDIKFVYGEDWAGMYIDNGLVLEGHSLDEFALLDVLKIKYTFAYANDRWLRGRSLPHFYEDVILEGDDEYELQAT